MAEPAAGNLATPRPTQRPFSHAPFFHLAFAHAARSADGDVLSALLSETLRRQPTSPAAVLEAAGQRFAELGRGRPARRALRAALVINPRLVSVAAALRAILQPGTRGLPERWARICAVLEAASVGLISEALDQQTRDAFGTTPHYAVLNSVASLATPRLYLEIGSNNGASLTCFRDCARLIGIDPELHFDPRSFETLEFHKETSDAYFARVLAQPDHPVPDVVFIDGLHESDQVLRDFVNAERLARPDAIVMLHDVVPLDPKSATKRRSRAFWVGDCWRALHFIVHHRPDLEIAITPVFPSGLALIRLNGLSETGVPDLPVEEFPTYADALDLARDLPCLLLRLRWMEATLTSLGAFLSTPARVRRGFERFSFRADDALMLLAATLEDTPLDSAARARLHMIWDPGGASMPEGPPLGEIPQRVRLPMEA